MKDKKFKLRIDTPVRSKQIERLLPIIAFDPGLTTGVVWVTDTLITEGRLVVWAEGNVMRYPEDSKAMGWLIAYSNTIIAEDFKLYPHKASVQSWGSIPAALCLGYIKGTTYIKHGSLDNLHLQMASHPKQMYPKHVLQEYWSSWGDGPMPRANQHIRDALSHLTYFLVKYLKNT